MVWWFVVVFVVVLVCCCFCIRFRDFCVSFSSVSCFTVSTFSAISFRLTAMLTTPHNDSSTYIYIRGITGFSFPWWKSYEKQVQRNERLKTLKCLFSIGAAFEVIIDYFHDPEHKKGEQRDTHKQKIQFSCILFLIIPVHKANTRQSSTTYTIQNGRILNGKIIDQEILFRVGHIKTKKCTRPNTTVWMYAVWFA